MAVLVTPTVEAASAGAPPRVKLTVTDTLSANSSVTITRQNPNGRIVPVRTPSGEALELSGGTGLVYDYEAPFGQSVYYSTLEDPATVSAATVLDETRVWLIHPGVPVVSQPVELGKSSNAEETFEVNEGVFWPMGRETPLIFNDGTRKAPGSDLTVLTKTAAQSQALMTLLSDPTTLLLNVPADLGLDIETAYISVGTLTRRRVSDIGDASERAFALPYRVVRRPSGGSQSARTLADIYTQYATLADVKATYATMFDLLAGP